MAAKHVAADMSEDEVMKLAPHHVDLIYSTGIKQKKDKGVNARSPAPTHTQKKACANKQDTVEGSGAIKHGNIALGWPFTTILGRSLWKNQKYLEDTRI